MLARSDEVHKQNMQYMEKEEEMTTLSLAETIILTENIKKIMLKIENRIKKVKEYQNIVVGYFSTFLYDENTKKIYLDDRMHA